MLTWDEHFQRDPEGRVTGVRYETWVPHWGDAVVYSSPDRPGEMFLDCIGLGIEMRPLGKVAAMDAMNPAEMISLRTLEQYGVWCLEAMVAIAGTES